MKEFDELDDILNSIKNKENHSINDESDQTPAKSRKDRFEEAKSQEIKVETEPEPELEPPQKTVQSDKEQPDLVWFEAKQPVDNDNSKKLKKPKIEFNFKNIKSNFSQNFLPKVKSFCKKVFTKQLAIIALIIVLVVAIAFGGVKLYDYSRVAYLKPYEKQYGIEYPVGILEEFCDQYGTNQNTVGELIIDDTNTDNFVANQKMQNCAYLFEGSDITTEQQFRSIDVTGYCDLESLYSTADSFLASSQKITFNTLFDKTDYKVIGAYYTNKDAADDSDYIFPYSIYGNLTQKSFEFYADVIEHRTIYNTDYTFDSSDNFLSVCVDSDFMDNFKFVVVCVEVDSKNFEKSATAVDNEKIHYPQIWFDENNKSNPYRFTKKWYPEIYTDTELTKTVELTADDFEQ
jgi:hypothetical protein